MSDHDETGSIDDEVVKDDDEEIVYSPESSYWSPWKTASKLEEKLATDTKFQLYETTTRHVIQVLHKWGDLFAGKPHMNSFMRATSRLLHETEECIIALHYLKVWWDSRSSNKEPFIVVDVCCGKGYLSMFLNYLIGLVPAWKHVRVRSIVLLDKTTRSKINWSHIDIANDTANAEERPRLVLWDATNLHDYDNMIERLRELNCPLAMIGIHLCKMLSPAFVSIVNGLSDICNFGCLAPCCLPRNVIKKQCTLPIYQYETPATRQKRLEYVSYRNTPRLCCLCQSEYHLVGECKRYPKDHPERLRIVREACKTWPCWSCGLVGHFASECQVKDKPRLTPKAKQLVFEQTDTLFESYCYLLATGFESKTTNVVETGLLNEDITHKQVDNWNATRKAVFIVATS